MKYKHLRIISIASAISLLGIIISQSFWLKKTLDVAEKQFNHRANQMLDDVVAELQTYTDTSNYVIQQSQNENLNIFDVIDTFLLNELVTKYAVYHQLDSNFSYGLVTTVNSKIIFAKNNFSILHEAEAYKVCLSCLWHKEYIHLSVYFPNKEKNVFGKMTLWVGLSGVFLFTTVAAFIFIIFSFYKQKRLAEIKNDFINNMTHELKTPLATISVSAEVLKSIYKETGNDRIGKYSNIIFNENNRMRNLVDKVLNVATLERGLLTIDKEEFDIHDTIYKVVESFCFETCQSPVEVNYIFEAENKIIFADKFHLRNILNNLVDNAVKYSSNKPEITIKTKNIEGFMQISVMDKGKGIPKDSLHKVFDKFYRVPSGNIHNVKGFGLGLYYVKTMVNSHNGKVEIDSTVNKGTEISVFFPQ
ncbi:MAG: HAMP domain-containing histidine kinase [Bacteroidales bacterium]|nr:HAMP domain-containing histidine kinase [Bacteroidales bacterium]MBN2819389.1 HAMP domain-containing histidine kinase [Bacteroidales bacterium]